MSIWFVAVAIAVSVALVQGTDPPLKVIFIAAIMVAGGVALVRYSVRSTVALVEAGLRAAVRVERGRRRGTRTCKHRTRHCTHFPLAH